MKGKRGEKISLSNGNSIMVLKNPAAANNGNPNFRVEFGKLGSRISVVLRAISQSQCNPE